MQMEIQKSICCVCRSESEETLLGWVDFLFRILQDGVIDALKRCSIKLNHSKVVQKLQHDQRTLIKYLEEIKPFQVSLSFLN